MVPSASRFGGRPQKRYSVNRSSAAPGGASCTVCCACPIRPMRHKASPIRMPALRRNSSAKLMGRRRNIDFPPFLVPHGDAKVVVGPTLREHIARHVAFVHALHDKNDRVAPRIDIPGAELLAQPEKFGFPDRVRLLALGLVRVIEYPVVPALANDRAAHRLRDPVAGLVVLEVRFDVLVGRELKGMAPPCLIPGGI